MYSDDNKEGDAEIMFDVICGCGSGVCTHYKDINKKLD